MTDSLPLDHQNLQMAASRLQRILWIWAGLAAAMGFVTFLVLGNTRPLAAAPWILTALVLALGRQPAFMALAAVQWPLALIVHLPGLRETFGPEPVTAMIGAQGLEAFGLMLVRLGLMVTAWNQFLTFRLLYGTAMATGPVRDLPAIPEVVSNLSDWIALASIAAGVLSVGSAAISISMGAGGSLHALDAAIGSSVFAVGFGLGAAFSPTGRRGTALAGTAAGLLGFLSAIAASRALGL